VQLPIVSNEAVKVMVDVMTKYYGNPSSTFNSMGIEAEKNFKGHENTILASALEGISQKRNILYFWRNRVQQLCY